MKSKGIKNLIFGTIVGVVVGFAGSKIKYKDDSDNEANLQEKLHKYKKYYNVLNQWVALKNINVKLEDYLREAGINCIAIYGMGEVGCRLYEELSTSSIDVKYGIDNYPRITKSGFSVINLNGNMQYVDAIVVTAIFDYENICASIKKYIDVKVISIEDLVFNNI